MILLFGPLVLVGFKLSTGDFVYRLEGLLILGLWPFGVIALFSLIMEKALFNRVQLTVTSHRLCYRGPLGARWSKELKSLYQTRVVGGFLQISLLLDEGYEWFLLGPKSAKGLHEAIRTQRNYYGIP